MTGYPEIFFASTGLITANAVLGLSSGEVMQLLLLYWEE
jgi:hypothetical protein